MMTAEMLVALTAMPPVAAMASAIESLMGSSEYDGTVLGPHRHCGLGLLQRTLQHVLIGGGPAAEEVGERSLDVAQEVGTGDYLTGHDAFVLLDGMALNLGRCGKNHNRCSLGVVIHY